jgi:Domain of unknown function (DUF4157)
MRSGHGTHVRAPDTARADVEMLASRRHNVSRPATHPVQRLQRLVGNRAVEPLLRHEGGDTIELGARPQATGILQAAARGIAGAGTALPHADAIQRAFGRHDVARIRAHVDAHASRAAMSIDAEAYACGEHVAFARAPSLRTAAHEAAHVVQQRAGVQIDGGLGTAGDAHERHADAVAERVVAGRSAAALLDAYSVSQRAPNRAVQRLLYVAGREIKPNDVGPALDAALQRHEVDPGGAAPPLQRLVDEAGAGGTFGYTNWRAAVAGTATLMGKVLTLTAFDAKIPNKLQGHLQALFDAYNKQKKLQQDKLQKGWVAEMTTIAKQAIAFRSPEWMLMFARRLKHDLGLVVPTTGALWADPDVGQVKARKDLQPHGGKVLADTELGEIGRKFGLSPQGAKSQGGVITESLEEFQQRNAAALLFWGALSALYVEGLQGTVHVWLPKGLTMGSIMLNEELPALHARQRAGEVAEIKFHVQTAPDTWSGDLEIEDLTIVDAYLAQADGVNKGGLSLENFKHAPGDLGPAAQRLGAIDEAKISAKLEKKDYHIKLETPIKVDHLKAALAHWLDQWRRTVRARAKGREKGLKLLAQYEQVNQPKSE